MPPYQRQTAYQQQAPVKYEPKESKLERCARLCHVFEQLPSLVAFFDYRDMFTTDDTVPLPPVWKLSVASALLDIGAGISQETSFQIHGITNELFEDYRQRAKDGEPFYVKFIEFLHQAPFIAERSAIYAMKIYFDSRSALEWLRVNRPGWNVKGGGIGVTYDPLQHMTEDQIEKELSALGNVPTISAA